MLALLLAACSSGSRRPSPAPTSVPERDPAAPGAYGVGVTTMQFQRTSNTPGDPPRELPTWIWYPTDGAGAAVDGAPPASGDHRFPIVVFSHGSGGQPQFYRFFEEHLASWGYVVVAPPHPGNTTADCVLCDMPSIIESAKNRPADVNAVLDAVIALKDDPTQALGRIIDPSRTALAGHSFGGWTAMIMAKAGRFNAVIAMAPGLPETLLGAAPSVRVPSLILGAGKDEIVPPASVRKLYDALPEDIAKTYVSLPDAHHLSFVDRCLGCTEALPEKRGQALTNRYATAFLQTYLAGDDRYAHYLTEDVDAEAMIVQ